jgi:hypothetical protein
MTTSALILEIIDSTTGSVAEEIEFGGDEVSKLLTLLEIGDSDFCGVSYDLGEPDIRAIQKLFGWKKIPKTASAACLRARGVWDELPYKIHTNRELLMMLGGEKPLAVFCDSYVPGSESKLTNDEKFEPHVQAGRFIKREHIEIDSRDASKSMRWIFYALPSEAWRIDAYILMKKTARISGWNDGFELMEGSLLGYTDEQNSIHLLKKQVVASAHPTRSNG